jgi:hypothetical protein
MKMISLLCLLLSEQVLFLEIKKNLIQITRERKRTYFNERRNEIQYFPSTDVSVIPCFGKFSLLILQILPYYSFLKKIHFKNKKLCYFYCKTDKDENKCKKLSQNSQDTVDIVNKYEQINLYCKRVGDLNLLLLWCWQQDLIWD